MKPDITVAVGVIENSKGELLLTRRPLDVAQGGLWEFPGGKVQAGESVEQALARELFEELGIEIYDTDAIMHQHYDYPDQQVELFFYRVRRFSGVPQMKAGQLDLSWVNVSQLNKLQFPKANYPLIERLQSEAVNQ